MALPFHDFRERGVDGFPVGEELFEDFGADGRKPVKTFIALVRFAPFAEKEALGFEAAEERVEGAFFDLHAAVGEGFAEGVAVLLGAKAGEDGQDQGAAAKLKAKVFEESGGVFAGRHIVYGIHCITYSIGCQEESCGARAAVAIAPSSTGLKPLDYTEQEVRNARMGAGPGQRGLGVSGGGDSGARHVIWWRRIRGSETELRRWRRRD